MTKQLQAAVAMMLIVGSTSLRAQTTTASTSKKTSTTHKRVVKKTESATEREIRELREEMRGQQAQIDALKQMNADKDAKLATASQDAQAANASAAAATAQAQSLSPSVHAFTAAFPSTSSTAPDLK